MRRNFLLICFHTFAFSQTGVFLRVYYQPSYVRHTNKDSLAFLLMIWWNNQIDYLVGKTDYYFSHPHCKKELASAFIYYMPPLCKESFVPFHIFTISFEISPRRAKCCYPLCHWSSLVIQVGKENEKSWNEIERSKCFWSVHSTKLTHSCQVLSSCIYSSYLSRSCYVLL